MRITNGQRDQLERTMDSIGIDRSLFTFEFDESKPYYWKITDKKYGIYLGIRKNGNAFIVVFSEIDGTVPPQKSNLDFKRAREFFKDWLTKVWAEVNVQKPVKKKSTVESKRKKKSIPKSNQFVDSTRITELKKIKSDDFDLRKLIRLCQELNENYASKNYLSVAALARTILNHVPPIFGYPDFKQVANNYGKQSIRKNLKNLFDSFKNISDNHLHEPISKRVTLPNSTQVEFRSDLDVLLAEIVRVLS